MGVGREAGDSHCGTAREKTRESGLFHNMFFFFFIIEAPHRRERGRNAGKTRFSEQSPGQPGEGRRVSLFVICALK